jgi:hypothetical protein
VGKRAGHACGDEQEKGDEGSGCFPQLGVLLSVLAEMICSDYFIGSFSFQ